MKQSKNQVKAKGNIYAWRDMPFGAWAHQIDNSAKETLTVKRDQESWGSSVTETL